MTQCLAESDYIGARRLIRRFIEDGMTVERVLLEVIAPTQAEMGLLWQADCVSVADEHAASRICERLVTELCSAADRAPGRRGPVVVACAEGEWHSLPAQLLAEILVLRGWRVHFLGADVPVVHLARYLAARKPVALLLSASLASRLPQVHHGVEASQQAGVPVIVGGGAFGPAGRLAARTGADAWAADARHAERLLEDSTWTSHGAGPFRPNAGAYAEVAANQWLLVNRLMTTLTAEAPQLRGHLAARMEDVIAAVQFVVEHLAAALFADDDTVFASFIRWLADYMTACREPLEIIDLMLEELARALSGAPRARQALQAGANVLAMRTSTY